MQTESNLKQSNPRTIHVRQAIKQAIDGMEGEFMSEFDDDYDEDGESLSVYEAAEIWRSNCMDEDYTFGYSEDELRDAL